MMAMNRNPNSYDFMQAVDGPQRRRLSRGALLGISASVLFHAAVLGSLYLIKVQTDAAKAPNSDPPTMVITTWNPPRQTKQTTTTPSRPIVPHPTAPPASDSSPILPVLVQPSQLSDLDIKSPPVIGTLYAPPQQPPPKTIADPNWISRPNADQLNRFYPAGALDRGVTGMAVLKCTVNAGGRPMACQVVQESPVGAGFGAAAIKLSAYFKMSPRTEDGQAVDGGAVQIPIRFSLQ